MSPTKILLTALAGLVSSTRAAAGAYAQCGGIGWAGDTTCVSGYSCAAQNEYYSQCVPGTGSGGGAAATTLATTTTPASQPSSVSSQTYNNPVIYEDLADNDVWRVNDTYYYTSSTMHYSPGAPILRSYDLVNWEYIGHAVPTLDFGAKYDLTNGQRAYVKGIYASTIRYRKSNGLWYWIGCIEYSKTYIYTASAPTGPWTKRTMLNTCLYDCGLLIDDDDKMYVAYGNTQISVAQLASDGLSIGKTQQVFSAPSSVGTLEGNRMYKKGGQYYIFSDKPANGQYIMKSSSPFGSYTMAQVALNMQSPVAGSGNPHQGSLVDTPDGQWYWMAFLDAYPGGRIPALAPVTWGSNGFPTVNTVSGRFGASYQYPAAPKTVQAQTGTDSFSGTALGPAWEWNHNPDTTKFTVNNGLKLSTVTVTSDLYAARNTLTHRIHGPKGTGTVAMDVTNMADGDRAGLALFRDQSAWVGVQRDGSSYTIAFVNGINMDSNWATTSTGKTQTTVPITTKTVSFRITADIAPGGSKTAQFYYSTDGQTFKQIGGSFTMNTAWQYFMGYRYGIFNYATKALGGSIQVSSFTSA